MSWLAATATEGDAMAAAVAACVVDDGPVEAAGEAGLARAARRPMSPVIPADRMKRRRMSAIP